MEDQAPQLQLSNADGTGSLRRRRRPALSCVQCRRRKVKCDREKPCGPCTRTKSPACTYQPDPRSNGQPAASTAAASTSQDSSHSPSPQTSSRSSDFNSMVNCYIAPGIFGPHGSVTQSHLPSSSIETGLTEAASASAIASLVEKVRSLESKLDCLKESELERETSLPIRNASSEGPGQFMKSRFYGESHWVNAIEPYEALGKTYITTNSNTDRTEINKSSDLYTAVLECKKMARTIKSARKSHPPKADVQPSLPSKDVCDELLQCYLRTFEGVFRVLHIPSFLREYEQYWSNTAAGKPSVSIKIVLVCAIGVSFYKTEGQARLRASATRWIEAAESWLSSPHEKSRLNLTGVQIHILLLLARQICRVDGDLIWISAGALLRSAMHIGLHRDPSRFPKISPFNAEMRRRLWATILEITVQSSLDTGMPPMLSLQDFDTRSPSNIHDEDIAESQSTPAHSQPLDYFTQTSTQIALMETLPLRLEITRLINNLRSDLSYDDTLRLGIELVTACQSKARLFQGFLATSAHVTTFQVQLLDTLIRRFILSLHRPFFALAKTNPKFYYSRKICLDTSLAIMTPASRLMNGDDDWMRLVANSVGFVKSVFLYSVTTVYLELLSLLEERQGFLPVAPSKDQSTSNVVRDSTKSAPRQAPNASFPIPSPPFPPQFDGLRNVLVVANQIAEARIKNGEVNAKGSVFLHCALARVDSFVSGTDPDEAVLQAAHNSIAESAALMRQAYKDEWGVDIEVGVHPEFDLEHGGLDVPSCGDGVPKSAGGGAFEDMDWEALMQDDSLDFGFGFEGSPENWMFGG